MELFRVSMVADGRVFRLDYSQGDLQVTYEEDNLIHYSYR